MPFFILFQTIEPSVMHEKAGLGAPHTTHCLANGYVMISCMGDPEGNAKGMKYPLSYIYTLKSRVFRMKGNRFTWKV